MHAETPSEIEHRTSGGGQRSSWLLPSVCAGVALYLYVNLFVFPRIPILLTGDQLYFWMDGQRILHGELPYRDFFQFTPPGTDLLYFSVFKLLGPHVWVTNMVVLALGVALCGVCLSIAMQMMELDLALPATILFLTLVYTKALNATHHWFSILAILFAVRILLRERSRRRLLAAGGLLGLACFFTQSHGVAALLAVTIWLGWQYSPERQNWLPFLMGGVLLFVGFAITLGVVESYFIATVGWKALWYFQVEYVRKYMVHGPETRFLGMPDWSGWRHFSSSAQYIFVYLLLPFAYAFSLQKCWKANSKAFSPEQRQKVMLVALAGAVLLSEVMFSLNWLRIYAISMPGVILALWLVGQFRNARPLLVRMVWIGILLIATIQIFRAHHRPYAIMKLPAGWAAVDPGAYPKLHWIQEHTRPEEFFFQVVWPGVYLPLRLRNPVFEDAVGPGIATRPADLQRSIAQLDTRQVRYILWSQQLNPNGDLDLPPSSLSPLRSYLHAHYIKVMVFGDRDEIWERKTAN